MAFIDAGHVITALLVLLCSLACLDLWRQYAINSGDYWFLQYTLAVRSDDSYWKLGFRLEDLEQKLQSQKQRWSAVAHAINTLAPRFSITPHSLRPNLQNDISLTRRSRLAVHNLLNNETSVGQVRLGLELELELGLGLLMLLGLGLVTKLDTSNSANTNTNSSTSVNTDSSTDTNPNSNLNLNHDTCGEEGALLRVGLNDFRTDPNPYPNLNPNPNLNPDIDQMRGRGCFAESRVKRFQNRSKRYVWSFC
jgi:hypothetical protein